MGAFVELTKSNGIAVILINNPPVNALSPGVPEALCEAIREIERDEEIRAAVPMGAGRTFVAGADIKELEKISSGMRKSADVFANFRSATEKSGNLRLYCKNWQTRAEHLQLSIESSRWKRPSDDVDCRQRSDKGETLFYRADGLNTEFTSFEAAGKSRQHYR